MLGVLGTFCNLWGRITMLRMCMLGFVWLSRVTNHLLFFHNVFCTAPQLAVNKQTPKHYFSNSPWPDHSNNIWPKRLLIPQYCQQGGMDCKHKTLKLFFLNVNKICGISHWGQTHPLHHFFTWLSIFFNIYLTFEGPSMHARCYCWYYIETHILLSPKPKQNWRACFSSIFSNSHPPGKVK